MAKNNDGNYGASRLDRMEKEVRFRRKAYLTKSARLFPSRPDGTRKRGARDLRSEAGTRGFRTGALPASCRLCLRGGLARLAVTDACNLNCFFCPISRTRRSRRPTSVTATLNEQPLREDRRLWEVLRRQGAEGVSITGGEPLLALDRTLRYIRRLRRAFGPSFRIPLNTNGRLATPRVLRRLKAAGLDEIRYDLAATGYDTRPLAGAAEVFSDVCVQIPVIPRDEARVRRMMAEIDAIGVSSLLLHELAMDEPNADALKTRGLKAAPPAPFCDPDLYTGLGAPVAGSRETALRLLDYARGLPGRLPVYFCSWRSKIAGATRHRTLRVARRLRRPFERVCRNGLIEKAVSFMPDVRRAAARLRRSGVPAGDYRLDPVDHRLETASRHAPLLLSLGYDVAVLRCLPTASAPPVYIRRSPARPGAAIKFGNNAAR